MNNAKAYMQYTEHSLYTATPGELLMMLLNAEVKNVKLAIIHIKAKRLLEAHERLIVAQEIMSELISSLDSSYEISKELRALYTFVKSELIAANMKKDIEKLEQILPIITELRDTWVKADQLSKENKSFKEQVNQHAK